MSSNGAKASKSQQKPAKASKSQQKPAKASKWHRPNAGTNREKLPTLSSQGCSV
jgi:hypothetical protein